MVELALIVAAVWCVAALLVLPLVVRMGRAAHRADVAAQHQHELLATPRTRLAA